MNEIQDKFDDAYRNSWEHCSDWYRQAEIDLQFYIGNQWTAEEKRFLQKERRSAYTVNKIRPAIDSITGYQRKHRLSSIFIPQENDDQETADQLTNLSLYVFQAGNFYKGISDSFEGGCITGINFFHIAMDYSRDPTHGDIVGEKLPYNGVIFDPTFRKADMSDCDYFSWRKFINREEFKLNLPKYAKLIDEIPKGDYFDDKFTQINRGPTNRNQLAVDEFWHKETFPAKLIIDPESGATEVWTKNFDRLKEYLAMAGKENYIVKPWRVRGMMQSIFANGRLICSFKNPNGMSDYPFVPFFGIFQPDCVRASDRFQGIVRQMRSPQSWSNRRRSQDCDIIESSINSGWKYEEGAVDDEELLMQSGQGKLIKLKSGYFDRVQQIPPIQVPPGNLQLAQSADADILEACGANEAMMGMDDNQQSSGVSVLLRQGAGLIKLQGFFDSLRESQKFVTQRVLTLIQSWSSDKIKRILNQEPTERLYDRDINMDVVIQEGVLTDHQRQLHFRQLVELYQLVGEKPPMSTLLREAPIQGKRELLQDLQKQEEAAQISAQELQQAQAQERQAAVNLLQAQATESLAKCREKQAQALTRFGEEDERVARATELRERAVLDELKAIKELENMDVDKLGKYLSLIELISQKNKKLNEQSENQDAMLLGEISNKNGSDGPDIRRDNRGDDQRRSALDRGLAQPF